MSYSSKYADRHRADYLLVRGVWKARCRLCAWETADPMRRQAMALFRAHIKEAKVIAGQSENGPETEAEPGNFGGMGDLVDIGDSTSTTVAPST
jgi:hypothetical protein